MPVASHEAGGQTIWTLLEQSIARWPDTKLVFSTSGEEHVRSFAELRADALRLAEGLRHRGLKQGDIVVVQLPHCPENLVTFLACMAAGLVFVPIPPAAGDAETARIVGDAAPFGQRVEAALHHALRAPQRQQWQAQAVPGCAVGTVVPGV